jgi:hypothetical protein
MIMFYLFCRMIHSPVAKMVLLFCILSILSITFLSLCNLRLKIVSTRSDFDEITTFLVIKKNSFDHILKTELDAS